jgi:hypothetical protein
MFCACKNYIGETLHGREVGGYNCLLNCIPGLHVNWSMVAGENK